MRRKRHAGIKRTRVIRLNAKLARQAKAAGPVHERSATAQLEFWMRLGKALDAVVTLENAARLSRAGNANDLASQLS